MKKCRMQCLKWQMFPSALQTIDLVMSTCQVADMKTKCKNIRTMTMMSTMRLATWLFGFTIQLFANDRKYHDKRHSLSDCDSDCLSHIHVWRKEKKTRLICPNAEIITAIVIGHLYKNRFRRIAIQANHAEHTRTHTFDRHHVHVLNAHRPRRPERILPMCIVSSPLTHRHNHDKRVMQNEYKIHRTIPPKTRRKNWIPSKSNSRMNSVLTEYFKDTSYRKSDKTCFASHRLRRLRSSSTVIVYAYLTCVRVIAAVYECNLAKKLRFQNEKDDSENRQDR